MPELDFKGHPVYFETTGSGEPLILHHGFGEWGDSWRAAGWVDALAGEWQVVTLDALGHGRSGRPRDPGLYTIEARAEAVTHLADEIGADRFAFFGFSLGGRVGYQLVAAAPERLRALIVTGMHAMPGATDRKNLESRARALRDSRFRQSATRSGDRPSEDPEALALSTEGIIGWAGAEDAVRRFEKPALVMCGDRDPRFEQVRQTAASMPDARFLELPGDDHGSSFLMTPRTGPAARNFLAGL